MSEMIDRVARAMYEGHDTEALRASWDEVDPCWRTMWIEAAKAGLAAMREPTEAMVSAAWPFDDFSGPAMDYRSDLPEYWKKMIDEALKE